MEPVLGLLSFDGRLDRLGFWRRYLILMAAGSVNLVVAYAAMIHLHPAFGVLLAPLAAMLLANLAITVRRLHDRGKSGWWLLVFFVAPGVAGGLLGELTPSLNPLIMVAVVLVALALEIWGLVEIGFLRGDAEPNAFGEPARRPLNRSALA